MSVPVLPPPVTCRTCQHYYITWDKHYPYGCRRLSLKAAVEPAVVVWRSTGQRCLAYTPKPRREA